VGVFHFIILVSGVSFEKSQEIPHEYLILGRQTDKVCGVQDQKCVQDATENRMKEEIEECGCLERCETLSFSVHLYQYPM
jgi:hypothetical protein